MQEGVDKLLVLSVETEDEMMMEEMTDVSLQQQEEEDPSNKVKSQKSPQELARLLATGDGASTAKKSILTSLLNTSWDSGTKLGGPGSDVATEVRGVDVRFPLETSWRKFFKFSWCRVEMRKELNASL